MNGGVEVAAGPMTGTLTATVLDSNGVAPGNIIRTTDIWNVQVNWTLSGAGAAFVSPTERWRVRVFIESVGPGFEIQLPPPVEISATGGTNQQYQHTFAFPPNPNMADPQFSGVYKIVVVLTLTDGAGNPLPIAGFHEGPYIQFYRPS